jgi:N-acetylmuramoyl-L-alanine amidase-like protein
MTDDGERSHLARRQAVRDRQRRHRALLIGVLVVAAFAVGTTAAWAVFNGDKSSASSANTTTTSPVSTHHRHAKPATTETPTTQTPTTQSPPTKRWTLKTVPAHLHLVSDLIPYGPKRRSEMAAYAARHYGVHTSVLHPKAIVLHFTASSTYESAHSLFSEDVPNLGELPGTCAHYIVDQNGTVYEQVPPTVMCRHTIGMNDSAIGIEMVQVTGSGATWADRQILDRPAQINADLLLVKWLQAVYGIPTSAVIGHAMANDFKLFHDNEGWRNDHTDWQAADVAAFRARLKTVRLR